MNHDRYGIHFEHINYQNIVQFERILEYFKKLYTCIYKLSTVKQNSEFFRVEARLNCNFFDFNEGKIEKALQIEHWHFRLHSK